MKTVNKFRVRNIHLCERKVYQMIRIIGWLALIWSVGGWLSTFIYWVGYSVKKSLILLFKYDDEEGGEMIWDLYAGEPGRMVYEMTSYLEENSNFMEQSWLMKIFCWPAFAKAVKNVVNPLVDETYQARLEFLKWKKAEKEGS